MSDQPIFAYVLLATRIDMLTSGPTPLEASALERHFNYLSTLTAKGTMLLVGRTLTTTPDTFGIAVFRAASEAEAHKIMSEDPAVQEHVLSPKLYPFKVVFESLSGASPLTSVKPL